MIEGFERRFYKQVLAYDSENDDYVVPTGKTFYMSEVGANSALDENTRVKIIIDPSGTNEIIIACHGDAVHKIVPKKINAGIIIRIELRNDSAQSETLGGFYKGELYG